MLFSMRLCVCVIFFMAIAVVLSADTIPGGYISGTWYQANSPYYITGNVTIPMGDTLVIEPGVLVSFLGYYDLTANGVLEAIGTEVDSIHFFPEDTISGWGCVRVVNDTAYSYPLSYCSFQYAAVALVLDISIYTVDLSHCSFRNSGQAISVAPFEIDLQITDCAFLNNGPVPFGAAINCRDAQGQVTITGCLFENNTADIYGGAIRVSTWYDSTITITDCVFRENWADSSGGAIYFDGCVDGAIIEHCTFDDNSADGAYQGNGGGAIFAGNVNNLDVSYSCFYDNYLGSIYGGSIRASGDNDVTLDHCTFGFGTSPNEVYSEGSNATLGVSNCIFTRLHRAIRNENIALSVEYSDFHANLYDIYNPPAGFGAFDRVNYNGDSCDCYYNIFMDPVFEDTIMRDFHLTESSPCIDAGDPACPYDPDSTITDMGAFYFAQTAVEEDLPQNPSPVKLTCLPNPFATATTIHLSGMAQRAEGMELQIYNISGRLVKSVKLATSTYQLGADLKAGVYFVKVDGSLQQKVVKIQ